jgi:anti-sigma factor RsiW
MRCREVVERVTAFLEGALAPAEAAALREHLRGCDGCTEYVEQIRATVRIVAATDRPAPDREALAHVFRRFQGLH